VALKKIKNAEIGAEEFTIDRVVMRVNLMYRALILPEMHWLKENQ